jgi:hypothetical protein
MAMVGCLLGKALGNWAISGEFLNQAVRCIWGVKIVNLSRNQPDRVGVGGMN